MEQWFMISIKVNKMWYVMLFIKYKWAIGIQQTLSRQWYWALLCEQQTDCRSSDTANYSFWGNVLSTLCILYYNWLFIKFLHTIYPVVCTYYAWIYCALFTQIWEFGPIVFVTNSAEPYWDRHWSYRDTINHLTMQHPLYSSFFMYMCLVAKFVYLFNIY